MQKVTEPLVKYYAFEKYNEKYDNFKVQLELVKNKQNKIGEVEIDEINMELKKMSDFAVDYFCIEANHRYKQYRIQDMGAADFMLIELTLIPCSADWTKQKYESFVDELEVIRNANSRVNRIMNYHPLRRQSNNKVTGNSGKPAKL